MRIINITDSQCKAKNPEKRIDIFPIAILKKFMEIANVAHFVKADYVVHTGDMFDIPRVSPDFVGQLVEIIKMSGVPWYVVPGNHDLYSYNIATISQTMLGLLAKTGVINILSRSNPVVLRDSVHNFSVSLQGQEYYPQIDTGNPMDYDVVIDPTCAYHILSAHGMLVDKPFVQGIAQTLVYDVKSNADLILAGHYHPGFPPQVVGKTTIINPGSMARIEDTDTRIPQYVIINIDNNGIKYVLREFKTAKKPEDIFNLASKKTVKARAATLNNFKNMLTNTAHLTKSIDIVDIMNDIANDPNNDVDAQLINDALNTVGQVILSKDDSVPKLDGFTESVDRVYITKIEAKNFMCYEDLDIDLDPGLNVIRGESNSGKTTIMRLIKWVQTGEPKGSNMISNWAKDVVGRITYSNGYSIERYRTKKDSGETRIYMNGMLIDTFKGVKDQSISVMNIHQMPTVWFAKDDKRNLSDANQLETSFLVTESPGTRASAIGRITGLQNLDAAIRTLNATNKGLSKEIGIREKLVNDNQTKLTQYNDLSDIKDKIDALEAFIDASNILQSEIDILKQIETEYNNIEADIRNIQSQLSVFNNMPKQKDITDLNNILDIINELTLLNTEIQTINQEIDILKSSQVVLPKDIYSSIEYALTLENDIKYLYDIANHITSIDNDIKLAQNEYDLLNNKISSLAKPISLLERVNSEMDILKRLLDEYEDINIAISNTQNKLNSNNSDISNIDHEIDTLFQSGLCSCPLCGQEITKNTIIGG